MTEAEGNRSVSHAGPRWSVAFVRFDRRSMDSPLGAECERQRRSVPKPRVAAQQLPRDHGYYYVAINPNGVAPSDWVRRGRNPVGVRWDHAQLTQGRRSHVAPTLGFESERRWHSQSLATVLRTCGLSRRTPEGGERSILSRPESGGCIPENSR